MAELLLFQLYGPLAAWGTTAVGEYRPSATHPGKSQIAGLIAAALGVRRDEEAALREIANGFGLAVRIETAGELERDYHTTQVPAGKRSRGAASRRDELSAGELYTILSQRDYRADAAWICALWLRPNGSFTLTGLAEALRFPRFTICLGRKACPPSLPLNPRTIKATTLREAFATYTPDPRIASLAPQARKRYVWEEPLPDGLDAGFGPSDQLWVVERRDELHNRARWQFTVREEHHAVA
ncbi:MAG: type I-E CRISPR-associated protein Cas5/CasD [Candidatus Dadabacteria bacterium]|nr:MAG: type I-E CRISPR-associated protein Cas5/CasD [Candidatus Dadabacteria bacterium]